MGWILMSEKELNRVELISQITHGKLSVLDASRLLNITTRQVQRLLQKYRDNGAPSLKHGLRGERSNRKISTAKQDYIVSIVAEKYTDFGPTLACEMLCKHHQITISKETLRKWMIDSGLWVSRKQKRVVHQPRLRREYFGELIQIDGSEHRWFEDRAPPCTLLVFIDDATSTLMELRFVPSESTQSYFKALEAYLMRYGKPVCFYSDKHSIFRVAKSDAKHGVGMTQFGRALNDLNIEILCANSSQAKGRVERANRTLQDRLIKEMRLAGVSSIEEGNAFLNAYREDFNLKFAKHPAREGNWHRSLNMEPDRLRDILCWREKRQVSHSLTLTYDRKRIILDSALIETDIAGKYVDTYVFPDGRFDVRFKGMSLPHRIFDHNQRVTHAAITDNKRLGNVLSYVKQEQEARDRMTQKKKYRVSASIPTNSEKQGYQPTQKIMP